MLLLFGSDLRLNYNFSRGALPSGTTFTRASAGTYFDADGVLQSATNNVPRFDYDPTSVYWFNASASTLSRWNMALANVKSGVANARILCVGDSITEGFSAGLTTYKTTSYPAQLAGLLASSCGVPARWDCFSGNGNEAVSTNELITDYTGWTNTLTDGSYNSTLGGWFFSNNGVAGNFTVQAVNPADTVRIWYLTGGGIMQVAVDGVNVQQINTAGSNVIAYTDVPLESVGIHSVSLSYVSGGRIWVSAFEFINTAKAEVRIINAAWQGGTSGDIAYAVNGFNSAPQITTQNADLVIIAIGTNDAIGSVSVATYTTNVQTAITAALAAGSSVLLVATSAIGGGDWSPYETALYGLALSNNVPLVSIYKKWGASYSAAKTAGLLGPDSTHPTPAGYVDMAASFASLLFGELTASPRDLLTEEQRANVIPYSDFSSAWAVQSSAVFTANQVVAPDGTLTAGALSVTTTIGSAYRTGTLACAGTATGSVWVRSQNGTNQTFYLMFYNATDGWKTKACTATPFWQRFTFTQALAANAAFYIGDFNGAAANLYIWGPQVEIGAFATSYVQTSDATAPRAADQLSFTIPTGVNYLIYVFDDNSTQKVSVSAGAYTVPTTLNRTHIKSIYGV